MLDLQEPGSLRLADSVNRAPHWSVAEAGETFDVSIIIPTRHEAGNIHPLLRRIDAAIGSHRAEIIFVDDSDDGTPAAILAAGEKAQATVRLIHRPKGQRENGLGGAVLAGFATARSPWLCVMDADLQHPPELLPLLLAQTSDAELVIATRRAAEGSVGEFSVVRQAISVGSTVAARILFPRALSKASDPMSGFFLVRRDAIDLSALEPRGYKILLEILVRTPGLRIAEVGFTFGERYAETSKADLKEGLRYLTHLSHLRFGENWVRALKFALTGASGVVVNTILLFLLTEMGGMHYLLSAVLATQGSSLWNFGLTEFWVFPDRSGREGRPLRFGAFFLMNNAALGLRGPMLVVLTSLLGVHYLVSNVVTLVALMLVRYALSDRLIWGKPKEISKEIPVKVLAHNYSIHGIISVASEAKLPELEPFRTQEAIAEPTITVRLGSVKRAARQPNPDNRVHVSYDEGLGALGFGIDLRLGDRIDVVASQVLKFSPHVLYTNVVEPILRWTFVRKGYALVHGACLAFGDDAYLVTARTDTGKTTTMLRILAEPHRTDSPGAFIADDLTLLTPEGRVLTYPKPMTISHHTVKAINSRTLRLGERVALLLQSRVHSRSGRKFAMWLTQHRLPVATINTFMQLVVPPPKYSVQRLIPGVRAAQTAKLSGLFVIQRGGVGTEHLDGCTALETVMKNCEDAYGFPPYQTIACHLNRLNDEDLGLKEMEIIDRALAGQHAVLVRSETMDWSDRIQAIVHNEKPETAWQPVMQGCNDRFPVLAPA